MGKTQSIVQSSANAGGYGDPNALSWIKFDNFLEARETWKGLEVVSNPSPFQKFDWLQSYTKTFDTGDDTELAIMVGRNTDGVPVALFPLCIRKHAGIRTLEWIGQHLNDYNTPIVASKLRYERDRFATAHLFDALVAHIGGVDIINLMRQPCVLSGQHNPYSSFSSYIEASSAHALVLGRDWPSFAKSTFSKSTLRRLKEKARKLSKHGQVSYTWHTSPSDRTEAVSRILEWKCRQLQQSGARNAFEDQRSTEFLTRAADSCSNDFKVITLDIDGCPVAGIITLAGGDGPLIYVMAYDQGQHTRLSPGMILLHHVIETAINDNQSVLDFSVGDEPYKVALCNSTTEMRQTIKGYSVKGKIVAILLLGRLLLKRKLKQSDRMMKLLQRGNRWRGQLKSYVVWPAQ